MLPYDTGICYYAFMYILCFVLLLSISFSFFFKYFFKNLVLISQRNGPRYQRVLALCIFFLTGVILKGQFFKKIVFDVYVCFVLCKFVSGLILWFMDNFWFDDLRAE